jgi:predicted small integral membrane protein
MFEWMAWTLPVAVFFISIGLMLFGMTVWEMRSPTEPRKGFLPMETTRGDRLFIGLLCAAYVHLAFVGLGGRMTEWFALDAEPSIWIATGISAVVLAAVMRKG